MKDAMSINNHQLCTVPRAYLWSVVCAFVPMFAIILPFSFHILFISSQFILDFEILEKFRH